MGVPVASLTQSCGFVEVGVKNSLPVCEGRWLSKRRRRPQVSDPITGKTEKYTKSPSRNRFFAPSSLRDSSLRAEVLMSGGL